MEIDDHFVGNLPFSESEMMAKEDPIELGEKKELEEESNLENRRQSTGLSSAHTPRTEKKR